MANARDNKELENDKNAIHLPTRKTNLKNNSAQRFGGIFPKGEITLTNFTNFHLQIFVLSLRYSDRIRKGIKWGKESV